MSKVIEVVGSLAVGGAERVAVEVAVGVAARGFEAEIVVAGESDGPRTDYERGLQKEIEDRGIHVAYVPFTIKDRAARRRMRDHLAARGADLVHVHNRPQDWQMTALATFLGVPVLYTVHLTYAPGNRKQQALYVACGRAVPIVVCVSRAVADYAASFEKVPESKLRVIYNGIRMDVFQPLSTEARAKKRAELGWSDGAFVFVCAARLSDQKGHSFLLDAFARMPRELGARLAIAGEGPRKDDLEARIGRLGIGDRVTLLGARRDVPELLGAADAYACASLQEGHPLSLLEAMAVELPVVAPRLPSIVEISMDGTPIFYGPEKDGAPDEHDPADITPALVSAVREREVHARRAKAARAHVAEMYSLDAMNDQHAELYRDILARRRRPELVRSLAAALV